MKNKWINSAFLLVISLFIINVQSSRAHCEIPCGIFDDSLRIVLIAEHITTIEKSMKKIDEFSEASDEDYHMITRWTNNKEQHAKEIQHIVSQYFLHQRIKITDAADTEKWNKYVKELSLLHELLIYSMKAKQTTDLAYIEKLNETLKQFSDSYFGAHNH